MPTLNFNWLKLAGLPDDGVVTDVVAAPVIGGPGAIITFKQAKRMRCGWFYDNNGEITFKLLDDDLFRLDPFQDDSGYVWLALNNKLYAFVSHAFADVGASSRLAIGVADAPWASLAYGTLDTYVDQRVRAILNQMLP